MPSNPRTAGRLAPCWVALATLALMLATEPRLAIVWDEAYTLGREARLRLWFRALRDPEAFAAHWQPPAEELVQPLGAPPPTREQVRSRKQLLGDPRVLAWFWPFAREEPHGHPPLYALLGLAGDVLTPWRPDLERARLGPMLVFSLTAGAIFGFLRPRYGPWPASLGAGAWVFQPNLFAHGHYATYDALLSALWLGALLAFWLAAEGGADPRRPRWGWVLAFGLLLGSALDTKLTGWFLPFPLAAWTLLFGSRRGWITLGAGGVLALGVVYVLNPPWWAEPLGGPVRFFASNLGRGETIRIKTLFLGAVVSTPDGSLPWYNTLVWTLFVTPAGFLAVALAGLARALRRGRLDPFAWLVVGNWAFFLLLRALPHTPGHDGVRQFLPAFGLLALAAALGADSAIAGLGRWGKVGVAASLAEGALSVALFLPVPLSYFSPIVGSLPGATALGMEPTFYWDALDAETLAWLRSHTGPHEKVRFASYPTSWLYLRSNGQLPRGLLPGEPGVWAWYVVQNRPGAFSSLDRALVRQGTPAWTVRKLGVPLLWVFPYDQVRAMTEPSPGPSASRKPRATRVSGATLGLSRQAVNRPQPNLLTRGLRGGIALGSGVHRGGLVDDRGAAGGGARDRGGASHDGLLVAKPLELATHAGEHAALLLGGADHGGRGADRGGGANRGGNHAGGDRGRALLLVTRFGAGAGDENAEDAREGQSQKVAKHSLRLRGAGGYCEAG